MELTVHLFVSLDGVVQGPGSPDEDPSGGLAGEGLSSRPKHVVTSHPDDLAPWPGASALVGSSTTRAGAVSARYRPTGHAGTGAFGVQDGRETEV